MTEPGTKTYSNDEITIIWKPSACIHSTRCWKGEQGLKSVFNPMEKPWIKPQGASTERIIEQISHCPSGALSFRYNKTEEQVPATEQAADTHVEVLPNGPLLVHGSVHLKHKGETKGLNQKVTAFCRCGASANKPYCDGSHQRVDFKD